MNAIRRKEKNMISQKINFLKMSTIFFLFMGLSFLFVKVDAQRKWDTSAPSEVNKFDNVRWRDLSNFDLSRDLILTLWFNQKTRWKENARGIADQVMKDCMNPGLGIKELHKQGLTGKGVTVAIIDQPMYLDHPEFEGKILAYKDTGCNSESSMHGPAVTSLLVGSNIGTAPGAKVYYAAAPSWLRDTSYEARALDWIVEENRKLPKGKKIRVVSVSAAPSGDGAPRDKNKEMWDKSWEQAEKEGILVLDCTRHHGMIGPCWYDVNNPENVTKCKPGFPGREFHGTTDRILVPTCPRTTAEEYEKGDWSYQFTGRGGLSWAIPYASGVLALGWQECPNLTSKQIVDLLFKSAYQDKEGMKFISPKEFISLVKKYKAEKGNNQQNIRRRPPEADFHRGKLESLPSYDPNAEKYSEVDLRGYDLTSLNIKDRLFDLMMSNFDSKTRWPKELPDSFDPELIMELGKNPGLGVRDLHKKGITGKGISLAVIDQTLLVEHIEYSDRLRFYEEIHSLAPHAQMHGPAVASIALGKTVGVAPEADLYYIAETHGNRVEGKFEWDFLYLAQSIDRILEVNKTLPKERRIRVISVSVGWRPGRKNRKMVIEAVERANKDGIFVISTSLKQTYGYGFDGLNKHPLADPDKPSSYGLGSFMTWSKFFSKRNEYAGKEPLLVPMDSRCTASPTGESDYVFYREGGWSWAVPYIAGLYALACQVKPNITPQIFWNEALNTADVLEDERDNLKYKIGKIVNPVKLIKSIQKLR